MSVPVLEAREVRIELTSGTPIVEDVSLTIGRGEIVGLVGESGSGKTTMALALLGHYRRGVRLAHGEVTIAGQRISGESETALRRLRGQLVSYVPQEPAMALNPAIRIGAQIRSMARAHRPESSSQTEIETTLARVELPSTREFLRRFPHQLSGGQQQRVAIAIALVCEPKVVVLDEPTTGLDVVVQHGLLTEIRRLADEAGLGILYVSHDLAVVGTIANRIAVMYAGRVVEQGPAGQVMPDPKHPYAHGLISAVPDPLVPRQLQGHPGCGRWNRRTHRRLLVRPAVHPARAALRRVDARAGRGHSRPVRALLRVGAHAEAGARAAHRGGRRAAASASLLEVEGLIASHRSRQEVVVAADRISFAISPRECVALVGESGSGKTTIARCVIGLHEPDAGTIRLNGTALQARASNRPLEARRQIQIVFQNPYDSLNPRHTVWEIIARPVQQLRRLGQKETSAEVESLLEMVRLPATIATRYPTELSGGERQRVAIARSLGARPDLLVCDEVTSALDVSVQGAVLELLTELRRELSLSMLFISHDLGVVASISDRVLVLNRGEVCEQGPVRTLLQNPTHPYTQRLIAAAPRLESELAG